MPLRRLPPMHETPIACSNPDSREKMLVEGGAGRSACSRSAFWLVVWLSWCSLAASGQTVFLNFNRAGQYTNNFNAWNDTGGANGGNFSFIENSSGGVGDSGEVSVFQSTDTTATYTNASWDFSTN